MSSTSGSGTRTENPHPSGFAVLPVHVLLDQDLNATDVRVLLALSSFVGGPDGSCFPSMRTISARAGGITKRQLARVFNGYTSDRYHPGLVERGYVEILVRAPRSNVYTLRFDRWGSKKTPDIDVTPPPMSDPDIDDTVTPTPVSPSIKGREQNQKNNSTPQPPAGGGPRLTRDDRDQIKRARQRTKAIARSHELCEACGEELETSVLEVRLEDGLLSRWASPLVERQVQVAVPRGDLEPREDDPPLFSEYAAMEDLIDQLRLEIRPTDFRHWIEPLELLRVSEEDGLSVLELAAPDPSHAYWLRSNQLPPGNRYTLDGTETTVRVGVIRHDWSELRSSGYHRNCAPDTEDE